MKSQQGLSLISIVLVLIVFGSLLLLGSKVVPVYSEYSEVRHAITDISGKAGIGETEIRQEFDKKAAVGGISSVHGADLQIASGSGFTYIRVAYRREVPLLGNVSLAFNFDTSAGQAPAQQ